MTTEYRLATNDDLIDIYDNFELTAQLAFPVVVAVRNNKIVGFFGTQNRPNMVIAGPLQVKLPNKAFVTLRLGEKYDEIMRNMGIRLYWFSVDKQESSRWLEQVEESGAFSKIEEVDGQVWFRRVLQ
jgi:hypothetical protein